jgi:hypothetical protein
MLEEQEKKTLIENKNETPQTKPEKNKKYILIKARKTTPILLYLFLILIVFLFLLFLFFFIHYGNYKAEILIPEKSITN